MMATASVWWGRVVVTEVPASRPVGIETTVPRLGGAETLKSTHVYTALVQRKNLEFREEQDCSLPEVEGASGTAAQVKSH